MASARVDPTQEQLAMVDTPRGRLGVPVAAQEFADAGAEPPRANTNVRIKIGDHVVAFAAMPTDADIDHVAQQLGIAPAVPPAFPPATGTPPPPTDPSQAGREFIPGMPVTPLATARKYAPEIGAAVGGFSPIPGGTAAGALAGSAIKRGGLPTMGDVGSAVAAEAGGQIMQRAPGFLKAGLTRGAQAISAGAERFGIPLGIGELSRSPVLQSTFRRLASNPFASRVMGRAGAAQSEAIEATGRRIGKQWFRGAGARKALLQTAKEISAGKSNVAATAAKTMAQKTLVLANLAGAAAEDPHLMTVLAARQGEPGLQALRQAWWTTVLDEATAKHGLRKGLVSPNRIVRAWDKLGEQGQRVLFDRRAPHLKAFVDTLREAKAAEVARAATHFPRYFKWTIGGLLFSGGGLLRGRAEGGYTGRVGELLGAEAALPWVAAHMLTEGPESAIGSLLAPAVRAGVSALTQPEAPPP